MLGEKISATNPPELPLDFFNIIGMHNMARRFTCYTIAQSTYDLVHNSHVRGGTRISKDEEGPATIAFVAYSHDPSGVPTISWIFWQRFGTKPRVPPYTTPGLF